MNKQHLDTDRIHKIAMMYRVYDGEQVSVDRNWTYDDMTITFSSLANGSKRRLKLDYAVLMLDREEFENHLHVQLGSMYNAEAWKSPEEHLHPLPTRSQAVLSERFRGIVDEEATYNLPTRLEYLKKEIDARLKLCESVPAWLTQQFDEARHALYEAQTGRSAGFGTALSSDKFVARDGELYLNGVQMTKTAPGLYVGSFEGIDRSVEPAPLTGWTRHPKVEPPKEPKIDGLTHTQIRVMFGNVQREYRPSEPLTPAQKAWAREDWSTQLRAKTKVADEKNRNRVTCQPNYTEDDE